MNYFPLTKSQLDWHDRAADIAQRELARQPKDKPTTVTCVNGQQSTLAAAVRLTSNASLLPFPQR